MKKQRFVKVDKKINKENVKNDEAKVGGECKKR